MPMVKIDDWEIEVPEGVTIIEAASLAGVEIPHLCYHPDLHPIKKEAPLSAVYHEGVRLENQKASAYYDGCLLCVVGAEGMDGLVRSCITPVWEGMVVRTGSDEVIAARQLRLMEILAHHPHACLTCRLRDGCPRTQCTLEIPAEERCCPLLGACELQRLAQEVGIRGDTPRYHSQGLGGYTGEIRWDYNLCVGCLRCVRACRKVGVGILGFVFDRNKRVCVGTKGETFAASGCLACGACARVCPTGAISAKGAKVARKKGSPRGAIPYTHKHVAAVPSTPGVYQLLDAQGVVIYIKGCQNLRGGLEAGLEATGEARYFLYEENPMFSLRENELLQHYLAEHGGMPRGNRDFEDLY